MDDLNRILASDESIEPSSGFAAAVMEGVRREAAIPDSHVCRSCRDRAYCEKATGIPGSADCALGVEATAQRTICELAHAPGCHRWFYQSASGSWERCMPEPAWASCDSAPAPAPTPA